MIDSGIGGFNYLKKLNKNNEYILFMDKGYFPYGNKSIEFLLKRTLYLCMILQKRNVDKIILACNTVSLIALPFLREFYSNIEGVFQTFIPYLNPKNILIGSKRTIKEIEKEYDIPCLDGTILIERIQKKESYLDIIKEINLQIKKSQMLILACTHFLELEDSLFTIPILKNKTYI